AVGGTLGEAFAGTLTSGRFECRVRHTNGSWRRCQITFTNMLDDPDVQGVVLNGRDVTEERALEEQLTNQALRDPLTGLANRALFRDRVVHAQARKGRRETEGSVDRKSVG